MTKDGDADNNLNNISYLNKIHFGGLIRSMMVNYGI
jgi:hypothetical protein